MMHQDSLKPAAIRFTLERLQEKAYDMDLSMAGDLRLSDYSSELSIFNKRRYFKKISEIQDSYSTPASELMKTHKACVCNRPW